MKRILIVDDDEGFLATLSDILSGDYEVVTSDSSKIARDMIAISHYDLVIADIQMPHFTGIELLAWVKEKKSEQKVVLMTGFGKILETHQAYEMGASGFLAKPFLKEDLMALIKQLIPEESVPTPPPKVETTEEVDRRYCKIPIEDFVSQKEIEYPIFIRLGPKHYVKFSHRGGKIERERLEIFISKGIRHLYILQEDFNKLIGFTMLVSKAVAASGEVDKEKKKRFLTYTGEMLVQQAFAVGVDKGAYDNAKSFLQTSLNVLTEDYETLNLLLSLSAHTDWLYAHSLAVAMGSVMISRELGFQSPQTLFKLSFAGLFHDIGKKEIPNEILMKPRIQLDSEEIKLLETHPTRSKDILAALKTAPTDVILLAYEHHEDMVGQGYPRRPPADKLHPLSPIIQMADLFITLTMKSPLNPLPKTAREAFKYIETFHLDRSDKKVYEALGRVIGKPQ